MSNRGWNTVVVLALLSACANERKTEVTVLRGACMGTSYTIRYAGGDKAPEAKALQALITERLEQIEDRFSLWRPGSELSRFNGHASTEPIATSPEMCEVLSLALRIAELSKGAYDPTVLPLLRLQSFSADGERSEPTTEELASAQAKVGWQKVIIEEEAIRKTDPGVEVDLNSVAKGWGVDQISELLQGHGISASMVEIGGEVRCFGRKPDGRPWRIQVELAEPVDVLDAALATSGDYRNFRIRADGSTQHHILSPESGENLTTAPVAVCVRASSCALADGLATALMLLGAEHAERLVEAFEDPKLGVLILEAAEGEDLLSRSFDW